MAKKIGIVSTTLNLRPEPSTDKAPIGKILEGSTVEVISETVGWCQVTGDSGTGYLASQYVDVVDESSAVHDVSDKLPGFRGAVLWIHQWEGHAGKPYWPAGASGVTLDPGFDLGHASPKLIEEILKPRLSEEHYEAVLKVLGQRGEAAKAALAATPALASLRMSRLDAAEIFPFVARPYWATLLKRFPELDDAETPGEVHTAMLSIAYNRGAANKGLTPLKAPIAAGDWKSTGELIASMQQDHKLEGIRKRRRAEGELILSSLTTD
jgi:hypothetical protein